MRNKLFFIFFSFAALLTAETAFACKAPVVPPITGATPICIGSSITLSDTARGGIWSATNGNAIIDSTGMVTGVNAGLDTIIYAVTNFCETKRAIAIITVTAAVAPVVSISGNLCPGATDTLNSSLILDSIVWANKDGTLQTNLLALNVNAVTVAGQSDGTSGNDASELIYPWDAVVDNSGNVYVSDQGNNRVQKWAPGATSGITVAGHSDGTYGAGADELYYIYDIFVDDSENIYVADGNNNRIQKWAPGATSGTTVAGQSDGTYGSGASQLSTPIGIYVDDSGNIYVADAGNDRIQEWAPGATSGITVAGGVRGSGASQLSNPFPIFVDSSGNIYIGDINNYRVQKWAPGATSGTTVAGGNGQGDNANQLYYPIGVYLDDSGNIYVADNTNNRIQKWAPGATSGITVAGTGIAGSGASQLNTPNGVFFDGSGNLYVADVLNNRVQEFKNTVVNTFTPVAAGSYTAIVTAYNGCKATDTFTVSVPVAPAITGTTNVCAGSTAALSDTAAGGTWSSTNSGIATVSSTGVVSGVSAGMDTIAYASTGGGCLLTSLAVVTVNALPVVSISGSLSVGGTDTLNSTLTLDSIVWGNTGGTLQTDITGFATNAVTVAGHSDGTSASGEDALYYPYDAFVDDSGNVYISDNNNRVQKWAPGATSGTTVAGGNGPGSGASQIYTPSGIYLDSSGNIYVADEHNNRVQKWASGATSGITVAGQSDGTYGSDASHLETPTGVYVDKTGNIYVADLVNDRVQKWTPGATSGTTVAGGNGPGSGGPSQLASPDGVYLDDSGNIYVGDADNNRVQKWAPGATSGITVAGQSDGTYGSDASHLSGAAGVYVDKHGNLYVADAGNNRIQKWAPGATSGTTVAGTGSIGIHANELYFPFAVYLDRSGDMYVTDYYNNRIQEFKDTIVNTFTPTSGGSYTAIATTSNGCKATYDFNVTGADTPVVPAITGSNIVCAGDSITLNDTATSGSWSSTNTSVATVNSAGVVTAVSAGIDTVQYSETYGSITTTVFIVITVNALPVISISGSLSIGGTDTLNSTLGLGSIAWANTGGIVQTNIAVLQTNAVTVAGRSDAESGTDASHLNSPTDVYLDGSGNIYVSDYFNARIQKWAPGATSGTTVAGTGTVGAGASQLYAPYGVYVDGSGNIYVADLDNERIQEWAPGADSGITVAGQHDGTAGNGASQFNNPTGVYVDGSGNIFVADEVNYRVQEWTPGATSGITVAGTGTAGSGASQLNNPVGVYVDASGNMYVADGSNNRIQKWAPGATSGTTVAGNGTNGSGASQFNGPNGVYLDGSGNIYVADYENARIQEWAPGATSGITVAGTGSVGGGASQLSHPTNVYVDGSGNIFVADNYNNRIQEFQNTIINTYTPTAIGSYSVVATTVSGCRTTYDFTINAVDKPVVPAITGPAIVCTGDSITLSDTATSGTWSSTNTGVATVSDAGVVTGIAAGADTITYSKTNTGGTTTVLTIITVNPSPYAGIITGKTTVCKGRPDTLADATPGGTWGSTNTSIATVSGGVITALSTGMDTITYSISNSCGTVVASAVMTFGAPYAGIITGSATICAGANDSLTDTVSNGVWSSKQSYFATISTNGVVTGVNAGSTLIVYSVGNACGTATATLKVSVNPAPYAGSISGGTIVCVSSTGTLTDGAAGGVWSSSNTGLATVSIAGVVSGIVAGIDTIKYTVSNSCGAAVAKTIVNISTSSAGTITGNATVCKGKADTLTDATPGGKWSSTNNGIATVSGSIVTGVAAGTDTIKYTVNNTCGTGIATFVITVNAPSAGTITGNATVCSGATDTLTDAVPGGTWSSKQTYYGTINSAGIVTGINPGNTSIVYTVSNACGSASTSLTVRVNPAPYAGSVTGSTKVCAGSTTTLADAAAGGVWSSSDTTLATVSGGVVSGVAAGIDTIKYTVSNFCGAAVAWAAINVNTPFAGTITGNATVCRGKTDTLTDVAPGGKWSSSNNSIATVSGSMVTGVSAGTDTIKYTVSNTCGSAVATFLITVSAPSAGNISGNTTVCTGVTDSLTDTVSGGTWTSRQPYYGTVSSTGVVTGVNAGSTVIVYSINNSCGTISTSYTVRVNPAPYVAAISGGTKVCVGATDNLIDPTTGGVWNSSDTTIATVSGGVVTGVSQGIDTVIYTVTNSCGSAVSRYVLTAGVPLSAGTITGNATVCKSKMDTLTDVIPGGKWSSSNSAIAVVGGSGIVTGGAAGTDTIKYTVSNSCGSTVSDYVITVTTPSAGTITGSTTVCIGATDSLTDSVSGGTWSSKQSYFGTINGAGVVTGMNTGNTLIVYSITNACGTATASFSVKVNQVPYAGSISGGKIVSAGGAADTLKDVISGGTWSSSSGIATIDSSGAVTAVSAGIDTIKYRITNSCGTGVASFVITVRGPGPIRESENGSSAENNNDNAQNTINNIENATLKLTVVPNPTQDVVTASYEAVNTSNTSIILLDVSGVVITTMDLGTQQRGSVKLPLSNLAAGMYLIELKSGNRKAVQRVIKE